MDEKMNESLQTGGRKEARSGGMVAVDDMVAVERPQGTAPISTGLFARRRIWRNYGTLDSDPVQDCCRRDSRSRPGSTGNYEHEPGRGEAETTLKERCQCTTVGVKARWSF